MNMLMMLWLAKREDVALTSESRPRQTLLTGVSRFLSVAAHVNKFHHRARPVSPTGDVGDRLNSAVQKRNVEVALQCLGDGIDLNNLVECSRPPGEDKTWLQYILGRYLTHPTNLL